MAEGLANYLVESLGFERINQKPRISQRDSRGFHFEADRRAFIGDHVVLVQLPDATDARSSSSPSSSSHIRYLRISIRATSLKHTKFKVFVRVSSRHLLYFYSK